MLSQVSSSPGLFKHTVNTSDITFSPAPKEHTGKPRQLSLNGSRLKGIEKLLQFKPAPWTTDHPHFFRKKRSSLKVIHFSQKGIFIFPLLL